MRRAASREPRSFALFLLPLVVAAAVVATTATTPVLGYLKLGTRVGSRTLNLEWNDFPIRYYVTERGTTGVTAQQFQAAISTSFGVWDAVDTADLSAEFAGFTAANPLSGDSMTVIGYQNRPDLDRVLGGDQLHHRYAVRRSDRVRHLLQHQLPVVDRCCRRVGTPRRAVDRHPRNRPPAGSRPLGPRRDGGHPRRAARARRGSRHVSDRLRRRQHSRSCAQGG